MSALEELFLEVEKHAVLRGHATLVSEARSEYQGSKYMKMVENIIELNHRITILQLENHKGNSVLEDYQKELARLRKIEAAAKVVIANTTSFWENLYPSLEKLEDALEQK